MNGPARDTTAVAAIECPQCGTQLRLLQPATVHTPISCCMCGATFYIQPIATAPMSETVVAPLRPAAPPLRLLTPPPPRPAAREVRRPAVARATALTGTAPPVPTHAAPGMPRPVELPEHLQRNFRTRWMESVLGASLVLLLVIAACAGGFVLISTVWKRVPAGRDAAADAAGTPADPAGENRSAPATSDPVFFTPAEPLPRPSRVVGVWESRADDGSTSEFEFRADGGAVVSPVGNPPPPQLKGVWFLAEKRADDLVIEIGPEFGAVGNFQFVMRFTADDAFTLTRTVHRGVVNRSDLRYVRAAPPP